MCPLHHDAPKLSATWTCTYSGPAYKTQDLKAHIDGSTRRLPRITPLGANQQRSTVGYANHKALAAPVIAGSYSYLPQHGCSSAAAASRISLAQAAGANPACILTCFAADENASGPAGESHYNHEGWLQRPHRAWRTSSKPLCPYSL